MVKVKDDYIEIILPEDLVNLKRRDKIILETNATYYKIRSKELITVDDYSIKFLHYGDVKDIDYGKIKRIYKVKEPIIREETLTMILFILGLILIINIFILALGGG